uniref:GH3 auxin-responsive promoter n=1 Tax=Leersia perrieri TaxID=77586 RepID=A0A0D9XSM3_9ORYZ
MQQPNQTMDASATHDHDDGGIIKLAALAPAPPSLDLIEELTTHAGAIQRRLLKDIVDTNAGTEYLRRYLAVDGDDDLAAAFKQRVPVVEYEDIKPFVDRIARGGEDSSLLVSSAPITEFLTSSGTSGGERKLMPSTADDLRRRAFMSSLVSPLINR